MFINSTARKGRPVRLLMSVLLILAAFSVLIPCRKYSPARVSAHSGSPFGPACGMANLDGYVDQLEWSQASTQTVQMNNSGNGTTLTATVHVMNDRRYLYLGITINDNEFSTTALYLPKGDGFRIDFDNDHSGSLFTPGDDVLSLNAGTPQFSDSYLLVATTSQDDTSNGGTSDGAGVAGRRDGLNHFELKHPLCSGDSLDFCLHPTDIVGFRLEYLDAEANGTMGGSYLFPGSSDTSEADVVIGTCSLPELFLPLINK